MKLKASSSCRYKNLSAIESALANMGGAEVVQFINTHGAGLLSWKASTRGSTYAVYMGLPIRWLDDLQMVGRVEHAVLRMASAVRGRV